MYYSTRSLKTALKNLENDKNIAPQDKEDIIEFINAMLALGIKPIRLKKEVYVLRKITQFLGQQFRKVEKKDILQFFSQLELSNYSDWSKYEFKVILKRFYKYILGNDEYYPPQIAWIKPNLFIKERFHYN
jgi:integrase/recombinase XerD